jgi:hypothetical protein
LTVPIGELFRGKGFTWNPIGFYLEPKGFYLEPKGFYLEPKGFYLEPKGFSYGDNLGFRIGQKMSRKCYGVIQR